MKATIEELRAKVLDANGEVGGWMVPVECEDLTGLLDAAEQSETWERAHKGAPNECNAMHEENTRLRAERNEALATLLGCTVDDVGGVDLVEQCERYVGAEVIGEEVAEALRGMAEAEFDPNAMTARQVARLRARLEGAADLCESIADGYDGIECDGGDIDRKHTTGHGYGAAMQCAGALREALDPQAPGEDDGGEGCGCYACANQPDAGLQNPALSRMILCPVCGNKRCPRAQDHVFACTASNEPGQIGQVAVKGEDDGQA